MPKDLTTDRNQRYRSIICRFWSVVFSRFAWRQSDGMLVCARDAWYKRVSAGARSSAPSFKNFAWILSGPGALFGFRLRNSFCTPVSEMTISGILSNLGGQRSGTVLEAGEKTLENWRFMALGFWFGRMRISPFSTSADTPLLLVRLIWHIGTEIYCCAMGHPKCESICMWYWQFCTIFGFFLISLNLSQSRVLLERRARLYSRCFRGLGFCIHVSSMVGCTEWKYICLDELVHYWGCNLLNN